VEAPMSLWGLTHRLSEECDLASHASEFVPPQQLMARVACQTIRTREDDPGDRTLFHPVT
jgi:hypothetical protein